MDLEDLGFAGLYPDFGEDGHEAFAERPELLLRVPDLADPEVWLGSEADVVVHPVGWERAHLLEASPGLVVLCGGQGRWGEADDDAHREPPDSGEGCYSLLWLEICATAEASWYDGVGHFPFLEAPARFDRELAAFTQRVAVAPDMSVRE